MNSCEYGKCDICGKDDYLSRKYYYYNLKCDCCLSGGKEEHFELIRYCKNCKPKPPKYIKALLLSEDYLKENEND